MQQRQILNEVSWVLHPRQNAYVHIVSRCSETGTERYKLICQLIIEKNVKL